MKKPIIGILPIMDYTKGNIWMLPGYTDGIQEAGGIPIVLTFTNKIDELKDIVDTCDGFLFTGGHDINPELYHEDKLDVCGEISKERDDLESLLFSLAYQQDKPILGICRGIQMVNVLLGGTLYQDLNTQHSSDITHRQGRPYDKPIHDVHIYKDTPLYELLHQETIGVNSLHHQAIKDLSSQLKPMAISPDDLIEAVYDPSKTFLWAIQWHPEYLHLVDENSQQIFKAFVDASKQD
ncbi:MAG: gamma-glutamyl-gamma-aminobutyrate hydrolase family protein [Erysipelotrichaceae bacterium]|nr:gamma-glutamyl-gamma-aminobutyrate hydrolase family protein [Erysipelotrichaceae bacterium]